MSDKSKVQESNKAVVKKTKTPPSKEQIEAINRAIEWAGGQGELGKLIDVTPASVSNWSGGINGVTANNARKIEAATEGHVKAVELSTRLMNNKIKEEKDCLELYR